MGSRCSRRTRRSTSVLPRRPRGVLPFEVHFQHSLRIGRLGPGHHVPERARALQVLDELLDVLGAPAEDDHRDREPALLVRRRLDRLHPHVGRERRLEPVQQFGPRERPLCRSARSPRAPPRPRARAPRGRRCAARGRRRPCSVAAWRSASSTRPRSRAWRSESDRHSHEVECRQPDDQQRGQAEQDLDEAFVVERAGREVGAQHRQPSTRRRRRRPARRPAARS